MLNQFWKSVQSVKGSSAFAKQLPRLRKFSYEHRESLILCTIRANHLYNCFVCKRILISVPNLRTGTRYTDQDCAERVAHISCATSISFVLNGDAVPFFPRRQTLERSTGCFSPVFNFPGFVIFFFGLLSFSIDISRYISTHIYNIPIITRVTPTNLRSGVVIPYFPFVAFSCEWTHARVFFSLRRRQRGFDRAFSSLICPCT